MQFPIEDIPQQSPVTSGMQRGASIYSQILQMLAAPEMMKTSQQTAQEDLKTKQVMNQYLAKQQQASLDSVRANTALTNTTNKWKPYEEILGGYRAQNTADQIQQSVNRFNNPDYRFSKDMSVLTAPLKTQFVASNPAAMQTLLANSGNAALAGQNNGQGQQQAQAPNPWQQALLAALQQALGQKLNIPSPQSPSAQPIPAQNIPAASAVSAPLPNISPTAQSVLPPGVQQLPPTTRQMPAAAPGTPQPQEMPLTVQPKADNTNTTPSFTSTPEQIKSAGDYAKLKANQAGNSAALNSRIDGGEAISHLFEQPTVLKNLETLTKYSGWEGAAKLQYDRIFHPKQYMEYQAAAQQLPTIISGSLKVIEGLPTSFEGLQAGKNYFNSAQALSTVKGDPSAIAVNIVNGMRLITDEQNALLKSGQKAFPDVIPQHKYLSSQLDKIAQGNPSVFEVSKSGQSAQYETKQDPKTGKWMVKDPGTGQWKSEDEL